MDSQNNADMEDMTHTEEEVKEGPAPGESANDNATNNSVESDTKTPEIKESLDDAFEVAGKEESEEGNRNKVNEMEAKDLNIQNEKELSDIDDTVNEMEAKDLTIENEKELSDIDDTDDLHLHLPVDLTGEGRNKLFQRGLKLEEDGKKDWALKCYLTCITNLKHDTNFTLLPQCLHNIGGIYYGKEDYEKAVQFVQAEKLYYENCLIDTTEIQKELGEIRMDSNGESSNITGVSVDAIRANEYEQLARICLDKNQPELALEYAGKATKIRQQIYGENHQFTQESLDLFTSIYAEVGKKQYSDSMQKFSSPSSKNVDLGKTAGNSSEAKALAEPVSILRKRKPIEGEKEKKVRFDETQVPQEEISEQGIGN
ncbi:hypothetical protein CHS0354_042568 [Potamilus streckersoni]|uniref:Consortin N-terminal domain-containing protein n=1 Tax=Potamilus streckersoni TaxID=2493646 RepID=A0AAE0WAX5_9BIVA|nr:hypothetical protein CHS0354_042568 [Potamilus streckersoni]